MPDAMIPLLRALRRLRLPQAAQVAVACSGGADSMALLHAAQRLWPKARVLHVDHGTRNGASAKDARFVRIQAKLLGLRCHVTRLHMNSTAHPRPLPATGFEARARAARYAAFDSACSRHGITHLLIAHHSDDQAETVALRLERGSGVRGLRGVPAQRALSSDTQIVRPFLRLTRARLRAALTQLGAQHREDSSNAAPISRRNVLRPQLAADPARRRTLLQVARNAARTFATEQRSARKILPERILVRAGCVVVAPLALLQHAAPQLHAALLLRLLPEGTTMTHRGHAAFSALLIKGSGRANLAAGLRLSIANGLLFVEQHTPRVVMPLGTVRVRRLRSTGAVQRALTAARKNSCSAVLALPPTQIGAGSLDGQRYTPLGAPGSRLLSDALRERGVPQPLRYLWPLCSDSQGFLWAPGLVPAERARVVQPPAWHIDCSDTFAKLLRAAKAATPPAITM